MATPNEQRHILDLEMDALRDRLIESDGLGLYHLIRWFHYLMDDYQEVAAPWEWEVWRWEILELARLAWEQHADEIWPAA